MLHFVLRDEAAKNIAPDHRRRRLTGWHRTARRGGRVQVERPLGPVAVVVGNISTDDGLELPASED